MVRPQIYRDETKVRVAPNGRSKLQPASDRRALVDKIIDNGGVMTLKEIDDQFELPMRAKVVALVRGGWLEVVEEDV